MTRCCLCRVMFTDICPSEPTDLPGTGFRCMNHTACAQRVAGIVNAHKGLGEVCSGE